MSMKLADLMKHKGKTIEGRAGGNTPDRFGKGAAEVLDKKEQRRRDQEAGLVPFAVKLHGDLIKRLHGLAQERQVSLNDLTADLLNAALGNPPAAKAAPAPAATPAKAEAAPEPKAAKAPAKPKAKTAEEPAPKPAAKKPAAKPAAKPSAKK